MSDAENIVENVQMQRWQKLHFNRTAESFVIYFNNIQSPQETHDSNGSFCQFHGSKMLRYFALQLHCMHFIYSNYFKIYNTEGGVCCVVLILRII